MFAHLTFGRKKYEELPEENKEAFRKAFDRLAEAKQVLINAVDEDAAAYDKVRKAVNKPKNTEEEKAVRFTALQNALYDAALVPLGSLKAAYEALRAIWEMVPYGNRNVLSDALCGAEMVKACLECEYYNVIANTSMIKNDAVRETLENEAEKLLADGRQFYTQIHRKAENQ